MQLLLSFHLVLIRSPPAVLSCGTFYLAGGPAAAARTRQTERVLVSVFAAQRCRRSLPQRLGSGSKAAAAASCTCVLLFCTSPTPRVALCTTSSAQASQTNKLCSGSSERGRGKCFAAAAKLRVRTARALQGSGQKWRRSESSHFCSFCNDTDKSRSHTVYNANPNLHLLYFLPKHPFDPFPLSLHHL